MSTVPAHAPVRGVPQPRRGSGRPALAVVRAGARPARAPFVLLVVGLLVVGLIALLILNTKLAENSFRLQRMQRDGANLAQQEQTLRQDVASYSSPQWLADRARALGMVATDNPAFVDTRTGKVLGKPKPGEAPRQPANRGSTQRAGSGSAVPDGQPTTRH